MAQSNNSAVTVVTSNQNDAVNVLNINNSNTMQAVALPTAIVLIESSVKDLSLKSTSILLDCAAQQSLISRQIVNTLQLHPFNRKYTTLVGFGSTKPRPQFYDVVKLTLYKPGFAGKANITALVVDSAPSVCSMPGTACFATGR